jgi:hypothetical protein
VAQDKHAVAVSMVGQPITALEAKIGNALGSDHSPSCEVRGENDGEYYFNGFSVITLSRKGVDYIKSVE